MLVTFNVTGSLFRSFFFFFKFQNYQPVYYLSALEGTIEMKNSILRKHISIRKSFIPGSPAYISIDVYTDAISTINHTTPTLSHGHKAKGQIDLNCLFTFHKVY